MVDNNDISPKAVRVDTVNNESGSEHPYRFDVARFDEVHPVVSGNKAYKLRYNLQETFAQKKSGIITMGGAYSNHLAATAFACREAGLRSAALIRGEITEPLNPTLFFCKQNDMELFATPRSSFHQADPFVQEILHLYSDYLFVPEGGNNAWGRVGAAEMLHQVKEIEAYTHIVVAIGTGTTFRGIADAILPTQKIIGIPVIKVKKSEQQQFVSELQENAKGKKMHLFFEYAGKGYARADDALFQFINRFYEETGIPTDFVYTGKLMLAVTSLWQHSFFPGDSNVLVIHSGGLQGNQSLPEGTLIF